jgi:putative toxin-antitoxin system antitoxin component (TIGR02293 family)
MNAMTSAREVAGVLGIVGKAKSYTALDLDDAVRRGLHVDTLDRVVRLLSPDDMGLRHLMVPKATLARRAKSPEGRLSPEESDRVVRLARIWKMALDCWKNEASAREFLTRKHMLLKDRTPLDVATGSETGAGEVERIIGRLVYGIAV